MCFIFVAPINVIFMQPLYEADIQCDCIIKKYMSSDMTKPTVNMRPAKTQISLGIRPVWSESSLCAQWVAKDPRFLHADSEDSDQTGRMPRLIWVFAGGTLIFLVLSCHGSFCIIYFTRNLVVCYSNDCQPAKPLKFSLGLPAYPLHRKHYTFYSQVI